MSKFFINRPIVAMVISIIMVIVGLVTLAGLPVAQFPKVVPPEIFIQANYVGADAQTIEASVATPIEQQMSGVDNMNYMYSVNANNGLMRMFVNFDLGTDPNIDQVLTQLRYAQAESQLPPDVRKLLAGPRLQNVRFPDAPLIQPVEHAECVSWESAYLDVAFRRIRPIPGKEAEYAVAYGEYYSGDSGEYEVEPPAKEGAGPNEDE